MLMMMMMMMKPAPGPYKGTAEEMIGVAVTLAI
jgi:hypothetical protein